ncbi:MAG: hypothetical protein A2283_09575 [Lentisphaerae bacterium RIFOXYA12_FULL_48_11]|nr:MAG: hypothetical protein A2283_09575 [Lentisphaerae bacterium RIFOXYA12_FULL_48_11]
MTEEITTTEESGTVNKDLILELNFVPDWARKPPETNFFDREHDNYAERPQRKRDYQDRRPGPKDRPGDSRARKSGDRTFRRRDERPMPDRQPRREPREWVEIPSVNVRFLPQHKYLSEVIRRVRLSRRAHPLMQVAGLFVSNPGSCEVRVEVDHSIKDMCLFQCKVCGLITLNEDSLYRHMMQKHLDDFLIKEEKDVPAPEGKFTCVLQCGLSGLLIGPPNHHSTAERIREIRTTQYPNMTEADYKDHLKTLHGPEKIEQWKDQNKKSVVYKLKNAAEGDKPMEWSAAELYFKSNIAPAQLLKARRVSLSGKVAREIQDRGLSIAIRDAWQKESRFPSSLVGALRGAFHNKDLQLFKAGKGVVFVSDIKPVPLDPDKAIPSIRDVLLYLHDHPGCTRQHLVDALRPGFAIDSKEASEILSPLTWLIERGHIIEFFDGTLSVIGGRPIAHSSKGKDAPVPVEVSGEQKQSSPVSDASETPSASVISV